MVRVPAVRRAAGIGRLSCPLKIEALESQPHLRAHLLGLVSAAQHQQMAAGVGLAALLRNRGALLCTLGARYLTDFIDISASFARGPDPEVVPVLVVFTILLLVLPAYGLLWLWRSRHG